MKRKATSAAVTVALALGATLGGATTALAESEEFDTDGLHWAAGGDNAVQLLWNSDRYTDFAGTGLSTFGWNLNGFSIEGMVNTVEVAYASDTQNVDLTQVSADFNDYGLTTMVGEGSADFGGGNVVDVIAVLDVEGNFARWTFDFDIGALNPDDVNVHISGSLGEFGDHEYTVVGADGLVATDSGLDRAVMGLHTDTAGDLDYSVVDGNEVVGVEFNAYTTVVTLGIYTWDICSFDEAYDAMVNDVPTLDEDFGGTVARFEEHNCWEVDQPVSHAPGEEIDAHLQLHTPDNQRVLDWFWTYAYEDDLNYLVTNLPAGLTGTVHIADGGEVFLELSGVAPEAGTYDMALVTYIDYDPQSDDPSQHYLPTYSALSLVVEEEEQLAATGASGMSMVAGGLAVLSLGAGLMLVARRVRITA